MGGLLDLRQLRDVATMESAFLAENWEWPVSLAAVAIIAFFAWKRRDRKQRQRAADLMGVKVDLGLNKPSLFETSHPGINRDTEWYKAGGKTGERKDRDQKYLKNIKRAKALNIEETAIRAAIGADDPQSAMEDLLFAAASNKDAVAALRHLEENVVEGGWGDKDFFSVSPPSRPLEHTLPGVRPGDTRPDKSIRLGDSVRLGESMRVNST